MEMFPSWTQHSFWNETLKHCVFQILFLSLNVLVFIARKTHHKFGEAICDYPVSWSHAEPPPTLVQQWCPKVSPHGSSPICHPDLRRMSGLVRRLGVKQSLWWPNYKSTRKWQSTSCFFIDEMCQTHSGIWQTHQDCLDLVLDLLIIL